MGGQDGGAGGVEMRDPSFFFAARSVVCFAQTPTPTPRSKSPLTTTTNTTTTTTEEGAEPLSLPLYLLGQDVSGRWTFALDISAARDAFLVFLRDGCALDVAMKDVRVLLPGLSLDACAIAGQAVALSQWHQTHQFCPRCGTPTVPYEAGTRRRCTGPGRHKAYPRTDPVVIMLVESPGEWREREREGEMEGNGVRDAAGARERETERGRKRVFLSALTFHRRLPPHQTKNTTKQKTQTATAPCLDARPSPPLGCTPA